MSRTFNSKLGDRLAVPGFPKWRENQHPQAETH
jgi:hypothetical protein